MTDLYLPIFDIECRSCDTSPCVGVMDEGKIRCTSLCGVHFFHDRLMVDWSLWNDSQEATE